MRGLSSAWHGVGRVVFHLAENKREAEHPFAFLATYTTRLSRAAKAQHVPLGEALREYGGARQRQALFARSGTPGLSRPRSRPTGPEI